MATINQVIYFFPSADIEHFLAKRYSYRNDDIKHDEFFKS